MPVAMSSRPPRGVVIPRRQRRGVEVALIEVGEPRDHRLHQRLARSQVGRGRSLGQAGPGVDGAVGESAHAGVGEQVDRGVGENGDPVAGHVP